MRSVCLLLLVAVVVPPVRAQNDRRDRQEPELTLETGARTGTCDAMIFTADGKHLIAVGDDKVVRIWPLSERGFDRKNATVLRWPAWREQRGGIKAVALPSNPNDLRIAIGGYGLRTSTVAILDRSTGKILQTGVPSLAAGATSAVMAIAWAPSGKRVAFGTDDGSVYLWDLTQEKPQRLGDHRRPEAREFNRVRMLAFLDESRLLSVVEAGDVKEWNADQLAQAGTLRFALLPELTGCAGVFRAVLSPDQQHLLAMGSGPTAIIKPLGAGETKTINLGAGSFCRSGAFRVDGKGAAIGVGNAIPDTGGFFMEDDDEILLVTLNGPSRPGPRHTGRVEALAWHGDGRLAVAGGDHHEIAIYTDPEKAEAPSDQILGAGRCLYGVRLSEDGRYVAYRTQRNARASHPNERGTGEWSAFDLQRRKVVPMPKDLAFPEPARSANGWTVRPNANVHWKWSVVTPAGVAVELPFDKARDETPRCFAFLPSTTTEIARIAIGHYYGFSVFEVTAKGAQRIFLGTGHADEVYALSPSADGKWLITAGRDQTLSAWNLEPWKSNDRLGVAFDDTLTVTAVDVGAPGWEAGLVAGDEVVFVAVGAKPVYDRDGVYGPKKADLAGTLAILRNPEPGKELYFGVQRKGRDKRVEMLTTVRQRPLWRMFPAFTGNQVTDWVVWMWRNSFYHTSTNGDFLIGWHVNHPTAEKEPAFHPAQLFRDQFHKPGVITDLINTRDVGLVLRRAMGNNPVQMSFAAIEPAPARIEAESTTVGPDGLNLTLIVEPRGNNPDLMPERVELWCEDYRLQKWEPRGEKFRAVVTLKPEQLRTGDNLVTLQAVNALGGRSQFSVRLRNPGRTPARRLFGLSVGINDYSATGVSSDGSRQFGDLRAAKNDAQQLREAWSKQQGKLYQQVAIQLKVDKTAAREDILAELDTLAKTAKPDDQLVIFLSGHGDYLTVPRENGRGDGVFVFCCPTYRREQYTMTGITTAELYEKLASIRCRKVVFLDACHSGQAAVNPVRSLTPGGKGPTILAACDQNEYAFEHPTLGNGLFTYAVLEALGVNFAEADGGLEDRKDGQLDPAELFQFVRKRMPQLLKDIGRLEDQQNPVCFPREPERYPIARN